MSVYVCVCVCVDEVYTMYERRREISKNDVPRETARAASEDESMAYWTSKALCKESRSSANIGMVQNTPTRPTIDSPIEDTLVD